MYRSKIGGDGGQTTLNRGSAEPGKLSKKSLQKVQVVVFGLFSVEVALFGL